MGRSAQGVNFCEVKGVTHRNDDGTSRSEAMKLCSVGDPVRLIPDRSNEHDRNAIRVVLVGGQQIGYISRRQAARFAGRVHLLTATVHSRVKDEWGNDTIKLRVVNAAEQVAARPPLSSAKGQPPSQSEIDLRENVAPPNPGATRRATGIILGLGGLLAGLFTGSWLVVCAFMLLAILSYASGAMSRW